MKSMMFLPILGATFLSVSFGIATPLRGPGYDPGADTFPALDKELVVVVTEATYRTDRGSKRSFWNHVQQVERTLDDQPGFVAFSKRRQVFGNTAWTVTVWSDERSLNAFMTGTRHAEAMRSADGLLLSARFVRLNVRGADIPVQWKALLQRLDESGRRLEYSASPRPEDLETH